MQKFDLGNMVVQHNELIEAKWTMDRISMKLFEMAVSAIDVSKEKISKEVEVAKEDIFTMFKSDSGDRYTRLREHLENLQKQTILFNKNNNRKEMITAVTKTVWYTDESNPNVVIQFHEDIMPYLVNLKERFTQYPIGDLMDLKSKYSIIIYKLLKMNTWKDSKITYTIKDLRRITDTEKEYSRFEAWERRVIKSAVEEINGGFTSMLVAYQKVYSGKRVVAIEFKTRKRLSNRDNDFHKPKPIKKPQVSAVSTEPEQLSIYDI